MIEFPPEAGWHDVTRKRDFSRSWLFIAIKLSLSLAAIAYVAVALSRFNNWHLLLRNLSDAPGLFLGALALQVMLSFLNLFTEACRWRILVSPIIGQGLWESFYQVLKGLQAGIITPARSGDIIARALCLRDGARVDGFFLATLGSLVQNMVILAGGLAAISIAKAIPVGVLDILPLVETMLAWMSLAIAGVVTALLIMTWIASNRLASLPLAQRFRLFARAAGKLGTGRASLILTLSITRYLIFCAQLWLMLTVMDVDLPVEQLWLIPVYFSIITLVPSIAIADLGIRGSIALFLFGSLGSSPEIFAAIFIVWLFNIALPASLPIFFKHIQQDDC